MFIAVIALLCVLMKIFQVLLATARSRAETAEANAAALASTNEELQRDIASRNPNNLFKYVSQATEDLERAAAQVREVRIERDHALEEKLLLEVRAALLLWAPIQPVHIRFSSFLFRVNFQQHMHTTSACLRPLKICDCLCSVLLSWRYAVAYPCGVAHLIPSVCFLWLIG